MVLPARAGPRRDQPPVPVPQVLRPRQAQRGPPAQAQVQLRPQQAQQQVQVQVHLPPQVRQQGLRHVQTDAPLSWAPWRVLVPSTLCHACPVPSKWAILQLVGALDAS